MKILNTFLRLFMAAWMVYIPVQVQADEIINNAQSVIDQSQEIASADALSLIQQDYMKLVEKLATEMVQQESRSDLYLAYKKYIDHATSEFQLLATQRASSDISWTVIDDFQERYQDAIRAQFVASWVPAKVNEIHANTLAMIKNLLSGFEQQCKVGRGDASKNYQVPTLHIPPYVSALNGRVNMNPFSAIAGGLPLSFNYSYTSATGGSEAANHDRAVAIQTAVTASNLANAAWMSSQFSSLIGTASTTSATAGGAAGALSSVNAALVAAAPYLLAVAVVVMVVADVMARSEAYKLSKRINKAQEMMDEFVADHSDVQRYYREQCGEYSNLLNEFKMVFEDLQSDETKATRLAQSESLRDEIQVWQNKSSDNRRSICQNHLNQLIEKNGCTQIPEVAEPSEWIKDFETDINQPKTLCLISPKKDIIEATIGHCALPNDKDERKALMVQVSNDLKTYQTSYPKEKVAELVSARLAMTFANPNEVKGKINDVSIDRLNTLQEKAFLNMMQLIRIRKQMDGLSDGEKALRRELDAQSQYIAYRNQLLSLGNDVQDVLFGQKEKGHVLKGLRLLAKEYEGFADQYIHVDEVNDLEDSIHYVIKLVEGLQ